MSHGVTLAESQVGNLQIDPDRSPENTNNTGDLESVVEGNVPCAMFGTTVL